MGGILEALVPIILVIALGKAVAQSGLLSPEGWVGIDRIAYYVLFPALIVSKLSVADFSFIDWRLPTALIGAQILMALVTLAIGLALRCRGPAMGVLVQSGVRWNTYIALALAEESMGAPGVALIAVAAAALIPTANTLSVAALQHFGEQPVRPVTLVRQLLVNPLILACVVGLAINVSPIRLGPVLTPTLDLLAQATIALGLLATGAAITVRGSDVSVTPILGWSLLRLLGLPLFAVGLALLLSLDGPVLMAILIATAVPTASNGTMLARQLGGDVSLAANLIVAQCLLATVTISAVLWLATTQASSLAGFGGG